MEKNLITLIKSYITPEYISSLSTTTNESEHALNKAFDVSIPALLMGMFGKDNQQLEQLLQHVKSMFHAEQRDFSTQVNGMSSVTDQILGAHRSDTVAAVAEHSGISTGSAQTVLQTSALGVFGYLQHLSPNFDVSTIQQFISENKASLATLLPTGISLAGLTNWFTQAHQNHNPVPPKTTVAPPVQQRTYESAPSNAPEDKGGSNIIKILIPLIIGIALIVFFYRSCNNHNNDAITDPASQDSLPKTETSTTTTTTTTDVSSDTREKLQVELPDGKVLDAYKGGIEDQLVAFLKKGDYKTMSEAQLKDTWFDFDHLNFETNSAKITADTEIQVQNIAAILTAFPDVRIKIGGYTDKTGNEDHNVKLSGDRAKAVATELDKLGKKEQVTGAEGYGSKFAKYEASASDSERALDRRVSLSVRNK